ncbi:AmmeMemoRadiSam system protein B [Candidatus Uhrbacteria bacterium]|nr:AmmeMemoRadiSam system protein B [Candidatus Uhrbacteria bacterium]
MLFQRIVLATFIFALSIPLNVYAENKTPLETGLGSFRDTIRIQGNRMRVGTPELTFLVTDAVGNIQKDRLNSEKDIHLGITSHHLPTAAPFIGDFYHELWNTDGPRDTFIIIGPDHLERCKAAVAVSGLAFQTPFATLVPDTEILSALKKEQRVRRNDTCFEKEHNIGVQTFFISYLYPRARIVPILVSSTAVSTDIARIKNILLPFQNRAMIIGSFDFSHYFSYQAAQALDAESEKMISDVNGIGFSFRHVDSPAGAQLTLVLAKESGARDVRILGRKNSFDFTGQGGNTTGYINAVFERKDISPDVVRLTFVGDIMLSRNVGDVLKRQKNWTLPFQDSQEYLKSADILFGNLESPISARGKNVGSIYSFRADPRAFNALALAGFDALSVANNHIGDWGREAMEDTIGGLLKENIQSVGGGLSEKEAHSAKIFFVNEESFGFLGYTAVGSKPWEARSGRAGIAIYDKKKMVRDITAAKKLAQTVIVSLHFGDEYKLYSNRFQQDAAHAAIDAGATLVIGHHPHVIEETEIYHGGLIAYSLGNFIFDQFFSKETRHGAVLTVYIKEGKLEAAEMTPTDITKQYRVLLKEKERWRVY